MRRTFIAATLAASGCVAAGGLADTARRDFARDPAAIAWLEVANPSTFARRDEPIYLPCADLGLSCAALGVPAILQGKRRLPVEPVDWDLDGDVDGVLTIADFAPAERKVLRIAGDTRVRAVPDRVRADPSAVASGAAEWRMPADDAAGGSLGAGGFGFWDGKAVEPVRGARQARVLADGSLYAATETRFDGWQAGGKTVALTARISATAGSSVARVRLSLSEDLPNLAIGFAKRDAAPLASLRLGVTGPASTYDCFAQPGAGLINLNFRGKRREQATDAVNHVSVMQPVAKEVEYFLWRAPAVDVPGALAQECERVTLPLRTRLFTRTSEALKAARIDAAAALAWGQRLADSELARSVRTLDYSEEDRAAGSAASLHYEIGVLMLGYDRLDARQPNAAYREAIRRVIGSYVTPEGTVRNYVDNFNIDAIPGGRMLLRMYDLTGEERYRLAAAQLREQLKRHPRTRAGAFWHKAIYPDQVWLDGVYMGIPFLADYSTRFEHGAAYAEAVQEFSAVRAHLRDPATGLYFHGWDESGRQSWANPKTGQSPQFWGRAVGWLAMALVDTLDYLPKDRADLRQPLIDMSAELAPAIVKVQDRGTGAWWQVLDKPGAPGNYLEASGSAMFVYFLAKGINEGYLPASYRAAAERGFAGLVDEFLRVQADGSLVLVNNCAVAGLSIGRDGSYAYYLREPVTENDRKGIAAFLMASVEMERLLRTAPPTAQ